MKMFNKINDFIKSDDVQEKIKKTKSFTVKTFKNAKTKADDYMAEYKRKKSEGQTIEGEVVTEPVLEEPKSEKSEKPKTKKTVAKKSKVKKETEQKGLVIEGLNQKTINTLVEAGYDSKEKLNEATDKELGALKGIGKAAIDKIRK